MQTLQKMKQDKIGSSFMGDYVSYSSDNGKTWSKPKSIKLPYPEGAIGAGVANGSHGIQLSNGRFVIQARYKLENKQKRVLFFSIKLMIYIRVNLGSMVLLSLQKELR